MNKLSDLLLVNDVVWIFCRNKDLAEGFLKQCETEGFCTLNGQKPTELSLNRFYGIFDDFTMGYLANMIWHLTLKNEDDDHVRIDYEKFISDEEDYICRTTSEKKFDYDDLKRIAYLNGMNHTDFYKACGKFIEGQTFEEYNAYIYRYLIESDWRYSTEQAITRMEWEAWFIAQCYTNKIPVSRCAVEVGYGCG